MSKRLARHPWAAALIAWVALLGILVVPLAASRRSVLGEVRSHAMGVAIAAAAGLDPADLAEIHSPDDMAKPAYARLQHFLDAVALANPDVRYVYVMRRSAREGAEPTDYEYVVDQAARDADGDGTIDRTESSELPGTFYDASLWPELARAWDAPTADAEVTPDPPYPDLISGYAPVRDADGRTVAVVGVDITASRIREKLSGTLLAFGLTWLALGALLTPAAHLFAAQARALEKNRELSRALAEANEMLQRTNRKLTRQNQQAQRELQLAQRIHRAIASRTPIPGDSLVFDKYHLSCDLLGGDAFDVFRVDPQHIGIYMADVAGRGTEAALVSSLVRSALESVRHDEEAAAQPPEVLLSPAKLMARLNEMLVNEIPEFEFVTLIYALLNISTKTVAFANAGHPAAFRYEAATGEVTDWITPTGPALGLFEKAVFTSCQQPVSPGDKVIFFSDGLTSVLDATGEEFGRERLHRLIEETGREPPAVITEAIKRAFDAHRSGRPMLDDFSLLVAEIR